MKIKFKDIVKIQRLEMEKYEEEDGYPVDYRIVANKDRAVCNILGRITSDSKKQKEIRDCIYKNMWNMEDLTYKPICDDLRGLGYAIVNGGKEND